MAGVLTEKRVYEIATKVEELSLRADQLQLMASDITLNSEDTETITRGVIMETICKALKTEIQEVMDFIKTPEEPERSEGLRLV